MKTSKNIVLLVVFGLVAISAMGAKPVLRIATFNIQNFGQSKLAKTAIADTLRTIVRKFDIVAVQEVSDVTNKTAGAFLKKVNRGSKKPYKMVCSRRTGEQANDQSSREQYAFYYNPAKVELLDTALYDDSEHDYFQREPYIAKFRRKVDGLVFLICTIHTAPEQAVEEIAALAYVAEWMPERFGDAGNVIFCGDFNASCSYASPAELQALEIYQSPYSWIVPDDAKTNLSKKTCAYDRFVVTETLRPLVTKWEVYRYFSSKAVSDHWPVYIEIGSEF